MISDSNDTTIAKSAIWIKSRSAYASPIAHVDALYRFGGHHMYHDHGDPDSGLGYTQLAWAMDTIYTVTKKLTQVLIQLYPFTTWPPGLLSLMISYAATDDAWIQLPPMSLPHLGDGSVTIHDNNYMYVGVGTMTLPRHISCYNFTARSWIEVAMPPESRCGCASITIGGCLCICHDEDLTDLDFLDFTCTYHAFDPTVKTWTTMTRAPHHANELTASVMLGNRFYAFGGASASHCICYDTDTKLWTEIAAMPSRRCEVVPVVLPDDQTIAVMGGTIKGISHDTVQLYHVATNTWSMATWRLPEGGGHYAFSAHVRGTRLYVVGGARYSCYPTDKAFVLDFAAPELAWQVAPCLPPDACFSHSTFF